MAISGFSSYPATIREFTAHWAKVQAHLGETAPMVLAGGTTLAQLRQWGVDLDARRDDVTDAALDRSLARQQLTAAITALQARVVEFNRRVRADFAGSAYERALAEAFAVGDGEEIVRQTLRVTARLWAKVDAIAPAPAGVALPVALLEGYRRAQFDADREALRLLYGALTDADVDLRLAREARNDLQDVIYPALKAYRLKVPTVVPAGHALLETLPALTPPEGGRTPEPVAAQATWNAAAARAEVTWSESADADLAAYEVRAVPGDEYVSEDEVVLATVAKGAPRAFSTAFALGAPGVTAGFKVYVVLASGGQRGSEAVFVTRP